MALTPDALEYRETPVLNSSFVVVELAAAAAARNFLIDHAGPIDGVLTLVDDVGVVNGHTYPDMPIGVLISAHTAVVRILTNNGGGAAPDAFGITIPIGQSLYLPIASLAVATTQYICTSPVSVACFYTD